MPDEILLCRVQHGFTEERSGLSNLLGFLGEATVRLHDRKAAEACCLDFTRAFGSVMQKVETFGIGGSVLN